MTKELTYVQVVSLNVVFGVSWVKGGRLGFLRIMDSNLMGSPFIYAMVREHKSILVLSEARWRTTTTRFNDAGTRH